MPLKFALGIRLNVDPTTEQVTLLASCAVTEYVNESFSGSDEYKFKFIDDITSSVIV